MIERHIDAMRGRPAECWPYPGYCNRRTGYGNAYWEGERWEAHRAAYVMLVGPIPDGYHVDHLCRNRACCNPAHLEPVPPRVNLLRGESPSAKQARQTHCLNGHELAGANLRPTNRGKRECAVCFNDRQRASYYARTGNRPVPPIRADMDTHCVRGHPRNAENLHVDKRGARVCRACMREHQRRYRARQ